MESSVISRTFLEFKFVGSVQNEPHIECEWDVIMKVQNFSVCYLFFKIRDLRHPRLVRLNIVKDDLELISLKKKFAHIKH